MTWTQELAYGLCYRSGGIAWKLAAPLEGYFTSDKERSLALGRSIEDCIDDGAPLRLKELLRGWSEVWPDRMTLGEAIAAVKTVDLQLIIETILSREWESWGRGTRWQRLRSELERGLREHVDSVPEQESLFAEVDYLAQKLSRYRSHRYEPPVLKVVEQKLHFLSALAQSCMEIDGTLAIPAPADASERLLRAVGRLEQTEIAYPTDAARLQTLRARLGELLTRSHTDPSKPQLSLERARAVANLIRGEHKRQLEAVLNKLAKAAQKPDYCLWRKSLGPEQDRLLPLEESWDHDWYVGPQ
jgi:hypothetical protein